MNIHFVKTIFDDGDMHSFKYKPFHYCCEDFQNNVKEGIIQLNNQDCVDEIPQFCFTYDKRTYEYGEVYTDTFFVPIDYCPHCGKRINIICNENVNCDDEFHELSQLRKELWEVCKTTDSKKEEQLLREQIHQLDQEIEKFYQIGEFTKEN